MKALSCYRCECDSIRYLVLLRAAMKLSMLSEIGTEAARVAC